MAYFCFEIRQSQKTGSPSNGFADGIRARTVKKRNKITRNETKRNVTESIQSAGDRGGYSFQHTQRKSQQRESAARHTRPRSHRSPSFDTSWAPPARPHYGSGGWGGWGERPQSDNDSCRQSYRIYSRSRNKEITCLYREMCKLAQPRMKEPFASVTLSLTVSP